MWAEKINDAIATARSAGRHDVADYLALKAANDSIRETGVRWLFDSLIEIAAETSRQGPVVTIEREDPHNFDNKGSNITGSLLRIRHGVRCLTMEAGWTRTPKDGIMRGGALAIARITHFGITAANTQLMLKFADSAPVWMVSTESNEARIFDSASLQQHFRIFLGD
jgi:hypothetical protein